MKIADSKPLVEIIDVVYIDSCAGCNHWRDYEHIGATESGYILYRCPTCGLLIALTEQELRKRKNDHDR